MVTPQWALEKIHEAKKRISPVLDLERPNGAESLFQIPGEIAELSNLKILKLGYNKLTTLPEFIVSLRELTLLDLKYNQFAIFPELIAELQNLDALDVTGSFISNLPKSIARLTNLKLLVLAYNKLSGLHESLIFPQNLVALDLSNNGIGGGLLDSISNLQNLNSLNLTSNSLKKLPESIGALKNLAALSVRNNSLSSLPESIGELNKLTLLNTSYNFLSSLPESVGKLFNLNTLILSNNKLSRLPESVKNLQNITTLDLSNNQLISVPESVVELKNLVVLDLSSNKISDLPESIAQLQHLKALGLGENKLTTLPESIDQIRNLETLDLSDNDIAYVPVFVANLKKLKKLNLSSNPVITPPLEVVNKGINAVRAYFRQLKDVGQDKLYEAKLLILGESGAGKTTLARKLKSPDYQLNNDEETTEGVDVVEWSFPLDGERTFRINSWDFGGQEIYHATHQFFLTKRSLYVLVCDTRKEDTDFYYWLNVIELLSENSPLIIVKNEKQERYRDINERHLRGQFDNLKEVLSTNLATNRGLNEITDDVKHYIQRLPHIGSPLPKTWVRVRDILEKDKRNYIRLDEYLEICENMGFSDIDDSMQLSEYLHDIGVFLHFQDDLLLKHIVILKPTWSTNAVYKVLDNKQVVRNLGVFTRVDIENIWDAPEYKNMYDELLQLMMKFKLCYEIPSQEGIYIAPQLLSENQPEYVWDDRENLLLRYTYGFMPKGILTQFIVVMHPFISEQRVVWKTGVVLEKDKTHAEIVEYYGKKEIHVRISGVHKKELMTIVVHELDKIHNTYKRLKCDKLIPCNCDECSENIEPHFYKNEQLQNFIEKRIFEIQCGATGNMVNVRGLIDDIVGWKPEKEISEIVSKQERSASVALNIGDNFSGTIITGAVENSFNKIESANISAELKENLKQLVQAVETMNKALPEKQAMEISDDLEKLVEEATKETPRQKWYSVSISGLTKAAENLGKIGEPVIKLAAKVLTLLA